VLAVIAFVAFWVILALVLVFIAIRGGVGGAREALQTQSRGGRKAAVVIFAFVYVAFGVAIPLLFLTGNHSNASAQIGGIKLTADEKQGRELFGQHCGVCHTLAGANAVGKIGPNLDQLKPPKQLVLNTINNGCLPNPPPKSQEACLGQGVMPADLVEGQQAEQVAAFVSRVAGQE
jgi:mono/diheme cytochrome c family protein